MAERLFLHVGLHKTASSSFQETCSGNSGELLSRGITYPCFDNCVGVRFAGNHSVPLFSAFTEDAALYHMNAGLAPGEMARRNDLFVRHLRSALLSSSRLLLSAEDVGDLSEAAMRGLRVFLGARVRSMRVVALVRSPYALHCSAYAAMTVHGGRSLDPAKLLSQKWKVERLAKVFGGCLEFYPFQSALDFPGGPVAFLLNLVEPGLHERRFVLKDANRGPSNLQARAQALLNQSGGKLKAGALNPLWRQLPFVAGEKFLLNQAELSAIWAELEAENEFFRTFLGEEFCDRSYPVSEDVDPAVLRAMIHTSA